MNECIPRVGKAMRACIQKKGGAKLYLANTAAEDPGGMHARGKYLLSQFGALAENDAILVDGEAAGDIVRADQHRTLPKRSLHYHGAGLSAVPSSQTQRDYTAFVHEKFPGSSVPAASMLAP